jgi:hypothetical protein
MVSANRKKASLIPRYLSEILYQLLSEKGEPIEIGELLEMASAAKGGISGEFVEKKLYVVASSQDSPLTVAEYPSFKLRSVTKFPDLSGISRGIKYLTSASKILFSSKEYVEVRELIRRIEGNKLYKFPTATPEYWMCGVLSEHKELFSRKGSLKIGLKEWCADNDFIKIDNPQLVAVRQGHGSRAKTRGDVTPGIYEANLESIIIEHLDEIEEGLELIQRQYVCSGVGRIDLLCKDKRGDIVVIELKKFGAKQDSIIDQVTRYMGWVKKHIAKGAQKVRGIIVVAKADDRLHYAVAAIPNVEIKTWNLTIR